MGIGMRELLIILVVVLLVFGTKKLKSIGSDLGGAMRGFKKAMSDGEQEGTEVAKQLQQATQAQPDAEFPEVKTGAQPAAAPPKGPAA